MKSDKTNKLRRAIVMRGVERRSKRRNRKGGLYDPNAEETAQIFHRQRADREAEISEVEASGDWLPISKIVSAVAAAKGARFDKKKNNKIKIEVCRSIVSDTAAGRLGTEQSPALMLLSREGYFKTPFPPSMLTQTLKSFDGMSLKKKLGAITEFLTENCWMKRDIATLWLGKDIPLPPHARPAQSRILAAATAEKGCTDWLISEMKINKEPPKRQKQYLVEAKQKYGVGPRPFRRAWDNAIKETGSHHWRNAGRPHKES